MKTLFVPYARLCKIPLALLSSFSAAVGFLLSAPEISRQVIILMLGIFLLACGSSALNQYQEKEIDAAMPRTCSRPIPSGTMKPVNALYFSILFLISGTSILLLTGVFLVALLGLFAVVWYNGIYTFLKRKTAFAVVPGALTGAIPPAIGWIVGGGAMGGTKLVMICLFFFLWQVPHSWLFIMKYGQEYEKAGLPTLTRIFTPLQMKRIIFSWIFATTISCLFLSVMGMVHHIYINVALFLLSSWLLWNGIKPVLLHNAEYSPIPTFKKTNYYLLIVMLLLSADKLFMLSGKT